MKETIKVTFLDYYGKEIKELQLEKGTVLESKDIPSPKKLDNLEFSKWSYGIDQPITKENNRFVAVYNAESPEDRIVADKLNNLNNYGLDLLSKIDHLPKIYKEVFSEQQSSYSRDGGNADGFGTRNHAGPNITGEASQFLEDGSENPDFDISDRILLNLNQPGVVYRMWFTTWEEVHPIIKIYIDGEETPSYELDIFALGETKELRPYKGTLVFDQQQASGGSVSYIPIVFNKSIKVTGSGNFYYNINYQKYPHGTELIKEDFENKLSTVKNVLENVGKDPKFTENDKTVNNDFSLLSGETKTLYESFNKETVTALEVNFNDFKVRDFFRNEHEDKGILTSKTISFNINVVPNVENKLVFKGVLKNTEQRVLFGVDGKQLEESHLVFRNRRFGGFEWRDGDYFADAEMIIPAQPKDNVQISIGGNVELYNLRLFTNDELNNEIDFSNEATRKAINFKGTFTEVTKFLEYDPNTLIDKETWNEIYHDEDIINEVFIKITYPDLGEATYAPVSSFFGFGAYGLFKTLGITVGLREDGTMYSFYPMPFEAGIKIELINKSNYDFNNVSTKTSIENNQMQFGEYGYFKTEFLEHLHGTETALKTGEPMTFLETNGQGLVAGVTHSMAGAYIGEHSRFHLEGDEQIYVDNSMSHAFHGTGTEDYYNGGWYFKTGVQTNPLFGQSNHNYREMRDRTVMLRTHITDPIHFRSHIDFKMEHGGWNESADADVFVVTYYYHLPYSSIEKVAYIDLTNSKDIDKYNYKAVSNIVKPIPAGTSYEGDKIKTLTPFKTYNEVKDSSSFTIPLEKDNKGIIIRREYLMKHISQAANVYVDNKLVGLWQSSFRNAYKNFVRQDEFYIPEEYTKNKETINIEFEVVSNDESDVWTEVFFEIYTIN